MRWLGGGIFVFLVAGCSGGCERGCLQKRANEWLGGGGPGGGAVPRIGGEMPITAACPDDLARCSGNRVRAAARIAPDTKCSPEGCACPWDDLGPCAHGCVVEGLELDVSRPHALTQLCAPAPGSAQLAVEVPAGSISQTLDGTAAGESDAEPIADIACEIERYRCDRGVVFACGLSQNFADPTGGGGAPGSQRPPHDTPSGNLAVSRFRCLRDCAEEGSVVLADVSLAQAVMLLCNR